MKHNIIVEGIAYRLRPIQLDDAKFIVELRSNPLLNKYLHPISGKIEDQIEWLKKYFTREGDYYFVIESKKNNVSHGLISIYDVDELLVSGEWGRWIIKPKSFASIESAYLIYKCCFEILSLKQVFCRTIALNSKVVSFHDSCEINEKTIIKDCFEINGIKFDAVEHRLKKECWQLISTKLQRLSELAAKKV